MKEERRIKKFWEWFAKNEHKYLFLSDIASENPIELERLVNELHDALQKCYHEGVTYETGGKKDSTEKQNLYITAEGVRLQKPLGLNPLSNTSKTSY